MQLMHNGEPDQAAMPAHDAQGLSQCGKAPECEIETRLSAIWAELFKCKQVGRLDDFFQLGGDSLLAAKLLVRVREAFAVELTLEQLFVNRSVSVMAECIMQAGDAAGPVPISSSAVKTLSYSQQRLWFLYQLEGPNPTYNISRVIRFEGVLDIDVFGQALQALVERQEALRASFTERDGNPYLSIDVHAVVMSFEQIGNVERWNRACAEERDYCFDLNRDRLYRLKLVKQEYETGGNPFCLLATFHHSVFDGWSVSVFVNDLATLYAASLADRSADLPELSLQFSDYAAWQQERLRNGDFRHLEDYWRKQLAQLAPCLELPSDRPRPAERRHHGGWVEMHIGEPAASRIKDLALQQNATLYMALLSAFAVLLGRYSNQTDIAIGSPVSNRPHPDLEHVVGFFVNTLVMRCNPADQLTFSEMLRETREVVLAALANQDIPFDLLVETIKPVRTLNTSPLFQVMFALLNEDASKGGEWARVEATEPAGGQGGQNEFREGVAHFDMTLLVKVTSDGLHCRLEYAKDMFDAETAQGVLSSFRSLVDAVGARPDVALSVFECIGEKDRHQQVHAWNQTVSEFGIEECVHERFERQVVATPDSIALVFENQSISFNELNNRSNYLAQYLLDEGLGLESRVGLYFERALDMVVAILAVSKAGACYVPLDPAHPAERTQFILADAKVKWVLSNLDLPESLRSEIDVHVNVPQMLERGRYCPTLRFPNITRSRVGLHPDNLVYWLYTSGTAGQPKGVMVRHSSLSNLCQDSIVRRGFNGECRNLQFAPISFDAASAEIFNALLSGSILHIPKVSVLTSAEEFSAYSKKNAINRGYIPPAFLSALDKKDFSAYRSLSVGGEAIPKEIARQWASVCKLTNAYGPTECTIACTSGTVDGKEELSIGSFIANVNGYVANNALQLVPVGVVGELYIGGECLARGYANDRRLTAEKFVPNPFSQRAGARLYRTGDLVRYRKDGKLEFIGRKDQQVKLRGYRIELGEIESCLAEYPGIKTVVAAVQGEEENRSLVVHYLMHDESKPPIDPFALRAFAQQRLPGYMVPAGFARLGGFPLTANGKIDRKSLPPVKFESMDSASVPPVGESEQRMAQLWTDLLRVEAVGRFENFFELGGHSLLAARLVSRVRETFHVNIAVRDLFENQTLDRFASVVEKRGSDLGNPPAALRITRHPDVAMPLSPAQKRLWFLYRFMEQNAVFNIPVALQLKGDLDRDRLRAAIIQVVARHDILRTRFVEIDGEARQVIETQPPFALIEEVARNEEALRLLRHREKSFCFNLYEDLLFRFCLIELIGEDTNPDGNTRVLHITLHHIIADGQSVAVLLKELAHFYNHGAGDAPMAPLPFQYADYITWQRNAIQMEQLETQTEYWRAKLDGMPSSLELPLDFARPREQTYSGTKQKLLIGAETCGRLRNLSKQHGATLFMTLISAFGVLLCRYSRQHDFAVGTPISKRELPGAEQLIGLFLNMLVLRFDLDPEQSFATLLRDIKNTAVDAYRHQDVPFESLVEQLKPERSLSHTPFFQVSVSLVEDPLEDISFQGLTPTLLDMEESEGVARYDLTFMLRILPDGGVLGTMEYNTDLFAAQTIERMLAHYRRLIEAIVDAPGTALCELNLLSDEERLRQVADGIRASLAYPRATAHALFEEQARRHPDAIAVTDGVTHLSYGELDRRANRIAHYLIAQGVAVDTCVGLCAERSLDMAAVLLGILKAGAAYVPLDPRYPETRLKQMIDASRSTLILCDRHLLDTLCFLKGYPTLALGKGWLDALMDNYPDTAPPVSVSPDNLAYVIFTSGSTGVPKGIAISHKSIARLVFNDFVPFEELDSYLCAASLSFDAFTFEFWGPLLHGKKSVLFEFKENSLESFGFMMRSHRVDCAWLTAALFNQVIVNEPQALGGLKFLLVGGEALSTEHIQIARNILPEVVLVNGYGPTENTTFSCTYTIRERYTEGLVSIPIGAPIDNSEAFVLDAHGALLPTRCVGELYVGGDGLARAYVNRPALTAERFVPHPYSKTPGARLYRTGDLVRRREDGIIEYIGRADDQVKVRGFRVELGEIEKALKEHADVDQSLVVAREDRQGERSLVAYVVPRSGADEDLGAGLARYLKGRVPEYAVPGAFVTLGAFPLNANGKIDRQRLPVPDESAYARAQYVAPRTALEERLTELWRANLGREGDMAIGAHDNYFAIGGDSIRSIALVSSAKGKGLHFTIKDLFAHPTIAELAGEVEEIDADTGLPASIAPFALLTGSDKARMPAQHLGRTVEDAYPLSMLQQGMWFHSLQNPDLSLYIDVVTYRLQLRWDPSCFEACLRYLMAKHAVLRTVFVKQGGQILQLVMEDSQSTHRYIDSRLTPVDERHAVVRDWVEAEKKLGISSLDNLWRIAVHQFDAETVQLTLVLHHAILDGWSVAALYAELFRLYAMVQSGKDLPAIVSPPGHQHFVDLENKALAAGTSYWKDKFEQAKLPWWTGSTKTPSLRVFCDVSNEDATGIEVLAQRLKVNERSVWCAVYLALIATINGARDVVGVTVTHGRPEIQGAENTLGLFLNTLPVRVKLRATTWEKLIADTNDEMERVYAHRHYPLAKIQLETGLDFSASLFNYTNFHVENHIAATTDRGFDENNSLLAFNVRKEESNRRYYCALNLEPSVFDAEFIRRIQGYVKNILGLLREAPGGEVDFRNILQPFEVENQLALWNPRRSLPDEECNVVQLIDAQVGKAPDAVAVCYDDHQYSYRFLDDAANGIAASMESRGLTGRSLVGIAMDRSFDMLAAVLACLKSGICYVPLDPNLPSSRIAYIVKDAAIDLMMGDVPLSPMELSRWETMSGAQIRGCMLSGAAPMNARQVHPAHLAYIIYTSGSTGKPKGVGVSHGNLINFVKSIREQPCLNRDDRLFAVTTLSFDIAFLELIVPLAEGAMIDISRADGVYDGKKIIHRLATRKISCMQATPSTWKLMLDAGWNGSPGLKALVGGEALPADLADKLVRRVDQLWNMYGPTETTIWSTTGRIRDSRVNIGHPLRNTSVYVLNETLDLLPTGVVGELYIGGAGLARGYENRPALTAERFVPNPFGGEADAGSRIYRTGDLVRYLDGGDIEYMGRADQQIKVRGYRVELGEIEEAIRQTALVKDALTVLRSDDPANPVIVAYLVPLAERLADTVPASDAAQSETVRDLREKLQQSLPNYMLPSAFVVLDEFPLTPNGKLDRKALPPPSDALRTIGYVAPEGGFESQIAAIWAEILKREKIGRHDNFFELGGHSLLIMQLSGRIDDAFDIAIALRDFYDYPVLSELASRIEFLGTIQTMNEELIEGLTDDEARRVLQELEKFDGLPAPVLGIADQP